MAPPCHKISGFLAAAYLHEFTFFSSHADFTGSACSFLPGCKSDIEDARSAFRFNGLQIAPGEFRPKAELVQGALYFPDWKEMRTLSALEHKRTHDNHPSLAFILPCLQFSKLSRQSISINYRSDQLTPIGYASKFPGPTPSFLLFPYIRRTHTWQQQPTKQPSPL